MNICSFKTTIKDWLFVKTFKCNKPSVHIDKHGRYLCRHHAKLGRFVVRNGDVGEILARFDSEKELRENIHQFPGMIMQMVTKSKRRTL